MSINQESKIKGKSTLFAQRYQAALHRYLAQVSSANLKPALKLGRQAVVLGFETLDLALIHEHALIVQASPVHSSSVRERVIKRAGLFFAEAIHPIEKTHRSALEANVNLSRLNQELKQRSMDLSSSNLKLKMAIAKRKVVEETLRQKERHSSGMLDQAKLMQVQLRHLSHKILSAQEEERKRISRELHDVIAQMLTGINLRLETLRAEASVNTKSLAQSIMRTQKLVEKSVDVVHRFARELRPEMLDDLGLIPALYSYMTGFTKATGIRVNLTAFAGVEELSNAKRTVIYRIAQEALTNIARHAKASKGEVIIEKVADEVRMQIKDNGKSFNVDNVLHSRRTRRLGLLGMRERVEMIGGNFMVESAAGHGTVIKVQFPFESGTRNQVSK